MSNIAFLIIYITLFPTLSILAILISITTFVRAQRAHLRTLHRLRSLEEEFILLVKTLENITTLAEADRRTMGTLANELQELERRVESQDNQEISPASSEERNFNENMNRCLSSYRRGLSVSRATTQSRRSGGTSRATHSRGHAHTPSTIGLQPEQPSRIPQPRQPAITIITPQHTPLSRRTHSANSGTRTIHLSPPQALVHETQDRIIHALLNALPLVQPALNTPQIVSTIEQLRNALRRSLPEDIHEAHHNPFADPPRSPSSTLANPPSPSSSFNFRSIFDTPPSSSTPLSGSTFTESLSGSTLVNSDGSDSDDVSLLMRNRRPRTYSRYSRYEELMLQRSSSILTPAQLAQVEGWEEELRAADGWVELGDGESEDESTDEGDLGV